MPSEIPKGWTQIRGDKVRTGDRLRTPDGWCDADNLGRGDNFRSAVGHPTSLYECVIRKTPRKKVEANA